MSLSRRVARVTLVATICTAIGTAIGACTATTSADVPVNGLQGVVSRGPITPVCRTDVPCDAPFAADFDVRDSRHIVTRFRSDNAGRYLVMLPPGDYTIVPEASAPLLGATQQTRAVTVGTVGLTRRDLSFDTGIR